MGDYIGEYYRAYTRSLDNGSSGVWQGRGPMWGALLGSYDKTGAAFMKHVQLLPLNPTLSETNVESQNGPYEELKSL